MPQRYKILITGSAGMLGVDLSQELVKDYNVYGMDMVDSPRPAVRSFFKCDLTEEKSVLEVLSRIRPDIVIHLAAWTDVDGCELDKDRAYKINSDGARNIALACKAIDAILIYISTDFVFDGRKRNPYKETDKPNPINIYAESKLDGERAIKKILKKYYILRTSWLYGKHGKNFVDTILEKSKREKVLGVVGDQVGSPTYTKDLAKAIHVLLDKVFTSHALLITSYGIYHITNAGSVSWYEYTKEILRLAGSRTKVTPISSKELGRPAKRPAMSVLDNSKFIRFTDYKMRSWQKALREYLKN